MKLPSFWFLEENVDSAYELDCAMNEDATLGVLNWRDLSDAEWHLRRTTGNVDGPWPAGRPVPLAALPETSCAPDYWTFGAYQFASRRLQDALAQAPEVLQFLGFDLLRASPAARAQKYCWMRVLASQEALDLSRCECEIEEDLDVLPGARTKYLRNVERLALQRDLSPRTEVFRVQEYPTFFLATDAVAVRVLRAGCTGIEFADPSNSRGGMRIDRYRTVDGVAERRVHFLD